MVTGVYGDECISEHTAFIYDRGGRTRVGQLVDVSEIHWERDRDAISEASLVVQGAACRAQKDLISKIIEKRHELVIFRGKDRVWEGPISLVGDEADKLTLSAKDVCWYLFSTPLSKVWDNSTAGSGVTHAEIAGPSGPSAATGS